MGVKLELKNSILLVNLIRFIGIITPCITCRGPLCGNDFEI